MTEPAPATEHFGALLAPVPMRTAGERIAERLVTAIALGEFEPGQRLPTERDLSATLEVSRTTVREALQRLQAAGYVTTRRGRGGGAFIRTAARCTPPPAGGTLDVFFTAAGPETAPQACAFDGTLCG